MTGKSATFAATLRIKLLDQSGKQASPDSLERNMGLVSAIREVADDEERSDFTVDSAAYGKVAERLVQMANDLEGDMKDAYLEVASLVQEHADTLS